MNKLFGCVVATSMFAQLAIAEPVVYTFDGEDDSNVLLSNIDPLLPAIRLQSAFHGNPIDFRSSTNPLIMEDGGPCDGSPGVVYDIQAPASASTWPNYDDPFGLIIDDTLPGWFDMFAISCFGSYTEPALPAIFYDGNSPDPCQDCWNDVTLGFGFNEVRYIPLRWKPVGDSGWMYGWVSFRVLAVDRSCNTCIPGFPTYILDSAHIDYVAFGYETTPDTPIFNGGFCPADMNFDTQLDFFDVSLFLSRFSSGNMSADMNGDGTLDFFDISVFLGYMGNDCEL